MGGDCNCGEGMESVEICSIVNSMVAQVEKAVSANGNCNHGDSSLTTAAQNGPRSPNARETAHTVNGNESSVKTSSAGGNTFLPAFATPNLIGASENDHESLNQVQNYTQTISSLPPVNLSNVFSDSCEIDMSDTRKSPMESPSSGKVQNLASLAISKRTSPRISISVTGVNLNILKKSDSPSPSPGSPASPGRSSPPSDSSAVDAIRVCDPGNTRVTNDEDTQDASVLFQTAVNKCGTDSRARESDDLKPESKVELSSPSLSDAENNNDGNMCDTELQEMPLPVPSSSFSESQNGKPGPPHSPPVDVKPSRSLLKRRHEGYHPDCKSSPPKKKRSITFDGVTVFYFPRTQGFTCVPSQV